MSFISHNNEQTPSLRYLDRYLNYFLLQHYCQTLKSRLQIRKVCILMFSHLKNDEGAHLQMLQFE